MSGKTSLQIACKLGNLDIVKILLNNQKIDINKKSKCWDNPLVIASRFNHYKIIEILLKDQRINKSIQNENILHNACTHQNGPVI